VKITIVSPAYNELENLELLCKRCHAVFEGLPKYNFALLLVDNKSVDGSWEKIRELKQKYPFLSAIQLSKNFGHQGGLLAGLKEAEGDAVICMDADLQHPPELIPDLISKWEKGFKVVNTVKANQKSSLLRKMIDKTFYGLMNKILKSEMGHSDFRLLDRQALDTFNNLPENEKFIRGLVNWIGFKNIAVPYNVETRQYGVSKYSKKHLKELVFMGLTSFSIEPLRWITKIGFLTLFPSAIYLLFVIITYILHLIHPYPRWQIPPGWSTLAVITVFFGSIQLLSIGIIGEYLGRIFNEVKKRPNFIIEDKI